MEVVRPLDGDAVTLRPCPPWCAEGRRFAGDEVIYAGHGYHHYGAEIEVPTSYNFAGMTGGPETIVRAVLKSWTQPRTPTPGPPSSSSTPGPPRSAPTCARGSPPARAGLSPGHCPAARPQPTGRAVSLTREAGRRMLLSRYRGRSPPVRRTQFSDIRPNFPARCSSPPVAGKPRRSPSRFLPLPDRDPNRCFCAGWCREPWWARPRAPGWNAAILAERVPVMASASPHSPCSGGRAGRCALHLERNPVWAGPVRLHRALPG